MTSEQLNYTEKKVLEKLLGLITPPQTVKIQKITILYIIIYSKFYDTYGKFLPESTVIYTKILITCKTFWNSRCNHKY